MTPEYRNSIGDKIKQYDNLSAQITTVETSLNNIQIVMEHCRGWTDAPIYTIEITGASRLNRDALPKINIGCCGLEAGVVLPELKAILNNHRVKLIAERDKV